MGVRFGGSRSIYTHDSELGLARLNFRPCAHFLVLIGLFILLLHLVQLAYLVCDWSDQQAFGVGMVPHTLFSFLVEIVSVCCSMFV